MTVKDFFRLCGFYPQTPRYYGREDLQEPVSTDSYPDYRNYSELQAAVRSFESIKKAVTLKHHGLFDYFNFITMWGRF